MGGEDEDYSYDYWVDEVFERHGDEYIAERAGEVVSEYQNSGLFDGILKAHEEANKIADALLEKAARRLNEGECEEALFAAFRALEGYCTSVFIATLHNVLTAPFDKMLPHVRLNANDLLGDSLREKQRYVTLGLIAVAPLDEAKKISKALNRYIGDGKEAGWKLRNRLFHSFATTDEKEAAIAISAARDILDQIRQPIKNRIDKVEAENRQRTAEREALRSNPFQM